MKTAKIARLCSKCQAPLPADATQELCARCLFAAATAKSNQESVRSAPPPLGIVQLAFPQLEVVDLLGHGGMGFVYKARQPRLDRFVALKILPLSLANSPFFAERFNREGRVLARLNHPNIVTVYDFGQSADFYFLLMEFVDGGNLRDVMQTERFTPEQTLDLVSTICEALQFAHNEGVLHRDIKPENILLDAHRRVKIADFGIAKLVHETSPDWTLTASGFVVGTPSYMAPEQLEHPQDVDQRADIYSLGVVLYEMLTAELPMGRFASPSKKFAMDPRIDEIVLRALENDRTKRFQSAGELKVAVEAIVGNPDSLKTESTPPERHTKCYFSTPERMRKCVPGPWAQVFHCKGELRLEPGTLVFVSPWRTRFPIPLNDICDLSVGQFQMWKGPAVLRLLYPWIGPWVRQQEPLNFISVTFSSNNRQQRVHFTPVPSPSAPVSLVNAHVAEWIDAIRKHVENMMGVAPRVSPASTVSINSQRAWNPRMLLFFIPLFAWIFALQNVTGRVSSPTSWALAFVFSLTLGLAGVWYAVGFVKTHQALMTGRLGAVTGNVDPVTEISRPIVRPVEEPAPGVNRPFWWTVSAWIFIGIGVLAIIDLLTGLYSRPISPRLSPGFAHLFAGIALLTLSRRWRVVALASLALALAVGAFVMIMTAVSPEHASVGLSTLKNVSAHEDPRGAAIAAVLLILALAWPCYHLLSAKGKTLFGLAKLRAKNQEPI